MHASKFILTLAALLLCISLQAKADTVAEIDDLVGGELQVIGFELPRDAEVMIDAVGIRSNDSRDMTVYAWLLDGATREPVWVMTGSRSDRVRGSKILRKAEHAELLPAGTYELYVYASRYGYWLGGADGFVEVLTNIFDADHDDDWDRDIDECYAKITTDDLSASDIRTFDPDGVLPNALIVHNRLGDSEYIQTGFELSEKSDLHLYGIIEYPRGNKSPVDYAWILDADSRDKVWQISKWDVDNAGGGRKNQKLDLDITLDKGRYILYVVTDDSHSLDGFNVAPPYDPLNWGITVLPGKNFKASSFKTIELAGLGEPLIDFTRARDNDYFEQSFILEKDADLHIYAIGEYGGKGQEFADYGAIKDARTGDIEWEMTRRNTDHAGGADKNRVFDGVVHLRKGTYTAFYVTDDSHSYRDWNSAAPFDPQSYGMSVFPGEDMDKNIFKPVNEDELLKDTKILARITRVRDDQRRREKFAVDKDTWVHVYALGEGTGGSMHDFAYIVDDDTGREVWEMTFRKTEHAGGASKNRLFSDEVFLKKGSYEVVYETDGSHSFGDWNSTPPRDPMNWGVTITLSDK